VTRATYHHGDLRRALVEAGVELARSGGADAVVLREVARRLGVSPAAMYRHFPDREALLGEVAGQARRGLARRMLDELGRVEHRDRRARAGLRFRATGRAYLDFAKDEPMLLAVAFLPIAPPRDEGGEPSPWHLLAAALDDLVAAGIMPRERREGAEAVAWSAVHGFATLRAGHAFTGTGEPEPDPEQILDAIARALELRTS
jgi:AcrR family transcriptional regulator